MSVDIKSLIMKKSDEKTKGSKLIMKDVNRDLIVALLAIPVYGKDARDEEILSIIINTGTTTTTQSLLSQIQDNFNKKLKEKKIKKSKDGFIRDTDGFIVLKPRIIK